MKRIIPILLLLFFNSCYDEVYLSLSEGVQELFFYEEGDKFILVENGTNDSLVFEVIDCVNEYDKERYNVLNPNQYHQYISIEFEGDDDCFGYMYSEGAGNAQVYILLSVFNFDIFDGSLCDTLYNYTLNNKEYPELYIFAEEKGKSPMLYYTKDEGIVYIDSTASGNSYTLIEFKKME